MLKEPEAPHQPSEDDTRPVSGRGDDRLLLWCLVGSLFINFGFGIWLNYADLYGEKHEAEVNKVMHFKTYIPPVKKPKPPPKKIPPLPKPKIIPKIVVKPLPHPPPPLPRPIAPQVYNTPTKSQNARPTGPPQTPPTAPPTQAPSDNTDIPTPKPNPQPQPQPQQDAPKPTPPAPPPAPKEIHKPGYTEIESQEADAVGSYPDPDVPQDADVTSLHSCTVTWDVNADGHAVNVRVTSRSGNSDLDDNCKRVIQGMRFKPAIQNHYPQEQRMTRTFNFS